ncbi:MAG TPA: YggS family pyridoxal phosphate-dependent enzyme [Bacteroidia bacterium]
MGVEKNLEELKGKIPSHVTLVAVSKTYPASTVMEAYNAGQRVFGENKVQELCEKKEQMPDDIEWHLIGHLQSNKVKYIAPFVSMIHSVDSLKLLQEINKQARKFNRVINCLLQIHIAQEETKFGLSYEECEELLASEEYKQLKNIRVVGLMSMASNTNNKEQIRAEFRSLKQFYDKHISFFVLSIGMSSDYTIAIEEGSTMIRVGSSIFGSRNYN